MTAEVEAVLDIVRPGLLADGGNVELVEITEDGFVKVQLTGACGHCPFSAQTLKFGIERTLKSKLPWVQGVLQV